MNIATEIDPSLSEPSNVADDDLDVKPGIEVASEIDVTSDKKVVASKADAAAPETDIAPSDDTRVISITADVRTSSKANLMSNDKSSDIIAPSRKLRRKPHVDQRRRRHSVAVVVDLSKRESEENVEMKSDADHILESKRENVQREEDSRESSSATGERSKTEETSSAIDETRTKMRTGELAIESISERARNEDSSSVEEDDEKAKLDRTSAIIGVPKTQVAEGSFVKSRGDFASKKKKGKSLLRSSLERKVGTVERMLEDHVERILEENVEKHPWLQPIESWIVDRKLNPGYTLTHCQQDNADRNAMPTYDFKFTAATSENEEPKIESRVTMDDRGAENREPRIERKVIEHLRKLRNRAGSPKPNRFEPTAQLKKQEDVSSRAENVKEDANAPIDPGVLEVKEVKRYDLLDKLKDNVKEKMEDIHRVDEE